MIRMLKRTVQYVCLHVCGLSQVRWENSATPRNEQGGGDYSFVRTHTSTVVFAVHFADRMRYVATISRCTVTTLPFKEAFDNKDHMTTKNTVIIGIEWQSLLQPLFILRYQNIFIVCLVTSMNFLASGSNWKSALQSSLPWIALRVH